MKRILAIILTLAVAGCFVYGCSKKGGSAFSNEITINRSTLTLSPGGGEQLSASRENRQTAVVWTSSNEAVARVDDSGYVTAVELGEAKITATLNSESDTCDVKVVGAEFTPVLKLSQTSLSVFAGQQFEVSGYVSYGGKAVGDTSVQWSSDKTSVATAQGGVVKGIAAGTATITATASYNGEELIETFTVIVLANTVFYVKDARVTLFTVALNDGESVQKQLSTVATVGGAAAAGHSVTWATSDADVVSVDVSGKLTAQDKGTARVTATYTSADGKTVMNAWTDVEVKKPTVTGLSEAGNIEVAKDDTLKIALSSIGYTGAENESISALISNKTYGGKISGQFVVIETDGKVFGEQTITIETADRVILANADITAKLVDFKVNRFYKNPTNGLYGGKKTEDLEIRYNADLRDALMVDGTYMLNTAKSDELVINPDGSTVLQLAYDYAVAIANTDNKGFFYYISDADALGSENVVIDRLSNFEGKDSAYKVKNEVRRTYLRIVGIDGDYLSKNSYTKLSFNLYYETAEAVNVVSSIYNKDMPSGKLFSYHLKGNVGWVSDWLKLYDATGAAKENVPAGQWITVEIDLKDIVSDSVGVKSIDIIIGCEAGMHFYMQGAALQ